MTRQILVCDDEAHIQRAISLKLTRAGFDVRIVSDVDTCRRLIQRGESVSLLIVDRTFGSGADGAELVRWVREHAHLTSLPVLMLVGNEADVANPPQALVDLKLAQIVAKPFSPRELVEIVNGLLPQESGQIGPPHARAYLASDCKL